MIRKNFVPLLIKTLFIQLVAISAVSCLSVRPAGVKGGKSLYEAFFTGDEGVQYFIKPLGFTQNNSSKEKLYIDFTFRYKDSIKDSVTVNFSLANEILFKSLDSIIFFNREERLSSTKLKLLFNEGKKEIYTSRFTTKLSLKEVYSLFNNSIWKITVINENQQFIYIPDKKGKKSIEILKRELFSIM